MFALILTVFFATQDPNSLAVNQSVLTKTESQYFTKEECAYAHNLMYEDMSKTFELNKDKVGAKQFLLTCSEVKPLLPTQKRESGVLPIPKTGSKYKFNGAREI